MDVNLGSVTRGVIFNLPSPVSSLVIASTCRVDGRPEKEVSSKELGAEQVPVCVNTRASVCGGQVHAATYREATGLTFVRVGSFSQDEVNFDLALTLWAVAKRAVSKTTHLSETLTRAAES